MKKELNSGILSAECRPTVGGVNVIAVLIALSLLHTYICYTPIATFQKAGTCLDAKQSMAKQPISGCVKNHSRTCGKSVSEKSE